MKATERAIIAAWIETDGSITIQSTGKRVGGKAVRYKARIQICQRELAPLEWLRERIGGTLRQRADGCWLLMLSSGRAYVALRLAMPYFISPYKKRRAQLALRLSRRGLTDEATQKIRVQLEEAKRSHGN